MFTFLLNIKCIIKYVIKYIYLTSNYFFFQIILFCEHKGQKKKKTRTRIQENTHCVG